MSTRGLVSSQATPAASGEGLELRLANGLWRAISGLWARQRPARQLRLRETLMLGEHRMVAVVEWRGQQLLIGSGGGSLSLLAQWPGPAEPSAHESAESARERVEGEGERGLRQVWQP